MSTRRGRFLFVALFALLTSAPMAAQSTRGALLVVGGGTQPAALVQEFVRLAGGAPKANIVVMAMASADGAKSGEAKAADFVKLGAKSTSLWFTREQANSDSLVHLLDSATGVWFGGGDQNKLTAIIRGTKMERAIRARWEKGAVVGGTSAGAAVLSTPMITGEELGTRRDTSEAWTRIERGSVQVDSGFGFITNAVIDQHFVRRKRSNRLLSLVLATPPHLGAGIDEGTAIRVDPNGQWTILGASVVIIYDARNAERSTTGPLGARDIRMHVLSDGMTFDPGKR
jgi:cyanophycinase